tara:strand:- start:6123 stop:6704 length:582 start_codon:yes stop_codon:yes gene_type:complete
MMIIMEIIPDVVRVDIITDDKRVADIVKTYITIPKYVFILDTRNKTNQIGIPLYEFKTFNGLKKVLKDFKLPYDDLTTDNLTGKYINAMKLVLIAGLPQYIEQILIKTSAVHLKEWSASHKELGSEVKRYGMPRIWNKLTSKRITIDDLVKYYLDIKNLTIEYGFDYTTYLKDNNIDLTELDKYISDEYHNQL